MVARYILITLLLLFAKTSHANYAELNGSTQYATVSTKTDMSVVPLIFYAEFEPTSLSSTLGHDQAIFTKLNTAGATYELAIDSADDKIHFRTNIGGAGGVNIVSNSAINANTRYRVVVDLNGSLGVTMYVNSTTAETSTGTSAALDTAGAGAFTLGGRGSGNKNFKGYMYMVRMNNVGFIQVNIASFIMGFHHNVAKIHEFGFFDGEGDKLYNTGFANTYPHTYDGTWPNGVTWHVKEYTWEIPTEHNYKYWPGRMDGIMWTNMGLSRETEIHEVGDYSYTYDKTCDEPQYDKYYVSVTGNNSNNGLTPATAFRDLTPLFGGLGVAEYGDCIIFMPGEHDLGGTGTFPNNPIGNPGSMKNMMILTGSGTGEAIIRFDHAKDLTWTAVDSNIYKTDWLNSQPGNFWSSTPTNVVIDDDWPYGSRRVWTYNEMVRDGDWFWNDTLTGTTTSQSSGKLIDSNANFGNEAQPTEVGDVVTLPNRPGGTWKTKITAIDSPTQLSVNDTPDTGEFYRLHKKLYIHTAGVDPSTKDIVIPENFGSADSFGFNVGGASYIKFYGLTMVGAGTYSVGGFTTDYTPYIFIENVVSKYSGKGTSSVGKYSTIDKTVSFGQGLRGQGNGMWGIGYGAGGGWPSVCGCRSGCIVAFSYGEGIGGQANPYSNFGDTRVVEDSIIISAWSVNLYAFDTTYGATARNNIVFNRDFRPRMTAPDSKLNEWGGGNFDRGTIWRRQFPVGFLYGDEVAAAGQTSGRLGYLNIHDNIFVNTRGCSNVFKEIALPLGVNHIDFVHNVCVSPSFDGVVMGTGWIMWANDGIAGGIYNDSSRVYNNLFIATHPVGYWNIFNPSETNTAISGLHLDHNYYFSDNPRSFSWKQAYTTSFANWKSTSGQDANSTMGTIDDQDVISPAVIGRADWGADVVNMTIDDFTPVPGSALINTGTLLLNEGGTLDTDFRLDMSKRIRPLGSAPDIGAIEVGEWWPRQHKNGTVSGGSF